MSDTDAAVEEKLADEKPKPDPEPHHTINQDLDIGTPDYPRYTPCCISYAHNNITYFQKDVIG